MKDNSISVVIPICSPQKELIVIVERLLKQTVKPVEIILINSKSYFDGSELIIEEITEKFRDIEIPIIVHEIMKDEFDHGGTRHMGIEMSNGEYILMMTQDAVPKNKHLLENMLIHFENDEKVAVVYAKQIAKKSTGIIEAYTRSFNYGNEDIVKTEEDMKTMGIKAIFSSDTCAMYKKESYMEIGGFPSKTIFNEDGILAYKSLTCGYKVVYASKAVVFHSHKYSFIENFKRNFDIGVSQKQYDYIYNNLPAENEGIKLVKSTIIYLISIKKWYLIPSLIISSGFKYMGYQAGKHYNILPKKLLLRCSMNKNYWKRGN